MKAESKKKATPVWKILLVLWGLSLGGIQSSHDFKIRQLEGQFEQLRQQANQNAEILEEMYSPPTGEETLEP